MKKLTPEYFLDQRKPISHIAFVTISLIVIFVISLKNGTFNSLSDKLNLFFLLFIQIEVFIFIAGRIFKELKTGITRKEFTKIVLSRFVIFYIACFFAALIIYLIFRYVGIWSKGEDLSGVFNNFRVYEFRTWFRSTISGLSVGALIFLVIQWQDALKREQTLREENLVFQNETLKTQVNPHFLFNSLNTISALIQSHPETAERFINELSTIYRYILENGQKNKVALQSELNFITGYFQLYKIRDEGKIILNVHTPDEGKFEIIPVSLQILLENAIKHNLATRENPLRISIYIEGQYIVVKNNLQKKATQLESTKIGLRNLAERVRLLTGRVLIIEETTTEFIVKTPLI